MRMSNIQSLIEREKTNLKKLLTLKIEMLTSKRREKRKLQNAKEQQVHSQFIIRKEAKKLSD